MSYIVAAVQMTSGGDKKTNLKKARTLLNKGVDMGAELLSLPENFSFLGGDGKKQGASETMDGGESVEFLKEFASRHRVWIVGGSIPVDAGKGKVFNRSLLIDAKGRVAAHYDKIHLFNVNIKGGESHRESLFIKKGENVVCADTPFGKIGLTICYDLRFPELYRKLVSSGARLLFVPSAFTLQTGKDHWEPLLRARAIENQCYVIAPAQFGVHNEKRQTYGNSMMVDPWGKVIARASDMETVITARVEPTYQDEVRRSLPCLRHL